MPLFVWAASASSCARPHRWDSVYGQTDDFGHNIVTLPHLPGLDHERLVYKYQGLRVRLTDVHGMVVEALLA